jgi:hypothetical protein
MRFASLAHTVMPFTADATLEGVIDSEALHNRWFGEDAMSRIGLDDGFTPNARRRTPRRSLIVVLPDNHVVAPDLVTGRLLNEGESEEMDVILACAGESVSIAAFQHRVRDLQVVIAPAGTSSEDLRELAMLRAPGDIVTLLTGSPVKV